MTHYVLINIEQFRKIHRTFKTYTIRLNNKVPTSTLIVTKSPTNEIKHHRPTDTPVKLNSADDIILQYVNEKWPKTIFEKTGRKIIFNPKRPPLPPQREWV